MKLLFGLFEIYLCSTNLSDQVFFRQSYDRSRIGIGHWYRKLSRSLCPSETFRWSSRNNLAAAAIYLNRSKSDQNIHFFHFHSPSKESRFNLLSPPFRSQSQKSFSETE